MLVSAVELDGEASDGESMVDVYGMAGSIMFGSEGPGSDDDDGTGHRKAADC